LFVLNYYCVRHYNSIWERCQVHDKSVDIRVRVNEDAVPVSFSGAIQAAHTQTQHNTKGKGVLFTLFYYLLVRYYIESLSIVMSKLL